MTRTTTASRAPAASLPSKTTLELRPGKLHDGRTAVHVVCGQAGGAGRDEEGAHFAGGEFVASLDGGLARHGRREPLVPRMGGGLTITGERRERLAKTALGVEARMRH